MAAKWDELILAIKVIPVYRVLTCRVPAIHGVASPAATRGREGGERERHL